MAAMAAKNSKSSLKDFYEKLVNSGKKKMVALTAVLG
jgi:transposase